MMAYGGPTPKRQVAKSNWPPVVDLNTGRMARSYMEKKTEFTTASI